MVSCVSLLKQKKKGYGVRLLHGGMLLSIKFAIQALEYGLVMFFFCPMGLESFNLGAFFSTPFFRYISSSLFSGFASLFF